MTETELEKADKAVALARYWHDEALTELGVARAKADRTRADLEAARAHQIKILGELKGA